MRCFLFVGLFALCPTVGAICVNESGCLIDSSALLQARGRVAPKIRRLSNAQVSPCAMASSVEPPLNLMACQSKLSQITNGLVNEPVVAGPDDFMYNESGAYLYTPERAKVAYEMLWGVYKAAYDAGWNQTFVMLSGPSVSGKSSYLRRYNSTFGFGVIINDDTNLLEADRAEKFDTLKSNSMAPQSIVCVQAFSPYPERMNNLMKRPDPHWHGEFTVVMVDQTLQYEPPFLEEGFDEIRIVTRRDDDTYWVDYLTKTQPAA